uniref:Lipid scramblase CLPTM1L n=1 Tax=Neolamprologus brichardi TaxID=32507 RepID=A0A3Q4I0D8_NEOBR
IGSKRSSIAKLLLGVFVVYMLHTAWLLYGFLNTKSCDGGREEHCITSYLAARPRLQMSVFTCLVPDNSPLELAVKIDPFDPHSRFERRVHVSLPGETRANGTLFAVVYVHKAGVSPLEDSREVHYAVQLTTYITPSPALHSALFIYFFGSTQKPRPENPVSHWRPHLSLTVMSEDFTFTKAGLPSDVRRYMRVSQEGRQMMYLPLLMEAFSIHIRLSIHRQEISSGTVQLPLTVSYEGISLRGFRFWVHLQDMVYSLQQFGFTDENIDEIKETLHINTDFFLALKNDISSWRKKKSMAGISRKTVLWRSLGTLLIFLYLLEETSLLVLLPVGLGACVEVVISISGIKTESYKPRKTVEYDTQASRYLSYLVYPLCISGAVFSLIHLTLSFTIIYFCIYNTCLLVSGVYAFGFLSMAPQLYINHKVCVAAKQQYFRNIFFDLCSCACFFSSSGSFSSSHQLSCFRDELLFFLYLYQRRYDEPKNNTTVPNTHGAKTLTGLFISYTLLLRCFTLFFLQSCLNSLWHKFIKCWEH